MENNTFGNLIKFSNGFLFVTKKSEIHTNSNRDIIFTIICKIRNRKLLDFSFNNLFFVLTGEKALKDNIEDKKKDIKNSINKNVIIINQNIQDESEFLISYFSNIHYSKYNQSKQTKILEKSNFCGLKWGVSKLIESSKKLLDESIKSGIINFIIYLTCKLDNINIPNKLKDINIEEVIQKFDNLKITIQNGIDEFKSSFENDIIILEENVRNGNMDEAQIVDFSSNWKNKKDDLNETIKNKIIEVYSEINEINNLKDSEYEKKKYFTKKLLIVQGLMAGAQALGEGGFVIFSTIAISFTPIAFAVGIFTLAQGGICIVKWIRDLVCSKDDLLIYISKYKEAYIDKLNSYKNDLNEFLERKKDFKIREIKDKNIVDSLKLNNEERKEFNKIYSSFEEKLILHFNFE